MVEIMSCLRITFELFWYNNIFQPKLYILYFHKIEQKIGHTSHKTSLIQCAGSLPLLQNESKSNILYANKDSVFNVR